MKLNTLALLLLLLIIHQVRSSELYELRDFTKEDISQEISVLERDFIIFHLKDNEHILQIEKVFDGNVNIKLFPFRNDSTYATIYPNTNLNVDLDRDNDIDMNIRMIKINDKNVTLRFVSFVNYNTTDNNYIGNVTTKNITKNGNSPNPDNVLGILLLLGIVLIGLFTFLLFNKTKRKSL